MPKPKVKLASLGEAESHGSVRMMKNVFVMRRKECMTNKEVFLKESTEMLEKAECVNIRQFDNKQPPGLDIHEMGGARMGSDPKTSILNKWNQIHACKKVFVTDGACMTSTGNQSPSILYMALTARAAQFAVSEISKGNL